MEIEFAASPEIWYAFLQIAVTVAFSLTAIRAWRHSRARLVELVTAFLFGLLLEQGDIFLFGTYRYNSYWVLLGDVPLAIAMTWAMIIAGAMNMTDAFGIPTNTHGRMTNAGSSFLASLGSIVAAPMADALWAILLDLALDAVAIRLGLWTWTIRAEDGWFGVPWGNFFAWLMVAFLFSLLTRRVRARDVGTGDKIISRQWLVPVLAFGGLSLSLVPFVAIENTAALPWVPDYASAYNNGVWIIFAGTLAVFVGVTVWSIFGGLRFARETPDHWLLFVRLSIYVLFLLALLGAGIARDAPLLVVVALLMLTVELILTRSWIDSFLRMARVTVTARWMERAE